MNDKNLDALEKTLNWFMDNKNANSWTISEMQWEKWNDNKFYDIYVEGFKDGSLVTGRGSDLDPVTATMKSIHEFVERLTCIENCIETNGVATHYNRMCAEKLAKSELIERHLIGSHISMGIPFRKINYKHNFLDQISNVCNVDFFESWECDGVTSYIVRGKLLNRNGYIYNTGTNLDENLELQFLRKFYALSECDFDAENEIQKNCLTSSEYGFSDLFDKNAEKSCFEKLNITTRELRSIYQFPFYTIRAESKEAISLKTLIRHFVG